ncbi:MAG: EcsC family protein [Halarcobacter sp.]
MSEDITESKMQQALDFAYDKAVNGVAGLDSAIELAENYKNDDCLHGQCNSLIRWQNTKAGTSGFVTGLGGLILMPVTLPANITSVLYVQIRMIAAIAHLSGHDLKDDKVKTMVYVCLVGNGAVEILKNVGVEVGKKVATNAIKNISGKVITQINQKVGFRLVTKFGEKGIINLGKALPILGGVIGGTVDTISTNIIGNTARNLFAGKNT